MTEYTASTTNNTNTITATPTDADAEVAITVNGEPHTSGTAATWDAGENEVVVTCTHYTSETEYTVTVTKS